MLLLQSSLMKRNFLRNQFRLHKKPNKQTYYYFRGWIAKRAFGGRNHQLRDSQQYKQKARLANEEYLKSCVDILSTGQIDRFDNINQIFELLSYLYPSYPYFSSFVETLVSLIIFSFFVTSATLVRHLHDSFFLAF